MRQEDPLGRGDEQLSPPSLQTAAGSEKSVSSNISLTNDPKGYEAMFMDNVL